jgi:hypothetical protein
MTTCEICHKSVTESALILIKKTGGEEFRWINCKECAAAIKDLINDYAKLINSSSEE